MIDRPYSSHGTPTPPTLNSLERFNFVSAINNNADSPPRLVIFIEPTVHMLTRDHPRHHAEALA